MTVPKNSAAENRKKTRSIAMQVKAAFTFCTSRAPVFLAFFIFLTGLFYFSGCVSPRVSYTVRTLHTDLRFSGRMLSNNDIAVLPFLTARGVMTDGEFEAEAVVRRLQALRSDLRFVSYEVFENGFPIRFDRSSIAEFYGRVFRDEVLAVKGMDNLWKGAGQPFFLVFALKDGAVVRNLDGSVFKRVNVTCEIWSRERREAVWQAGCTAVSDDTRVADSEMITDCMRRLVRAIPIAAPGYGQGSW